ncbi:MAG: VCBS repeat-containing protein [Myxococcales bacterium]|nr:VCBS repeat-containing protein [Myxococcales bacterium]
MSGEIARGTAFILLFAAAAAVGCGEPTIATQAGESASSTSGGGTDGMTSTSGASATETTGGESSSTSTTSEVEPLCGDGIAAPGEFCYELGPSGGIAGVILTLGVGDVNGDGRDDLIAGSNTGRRHVFLVEADTLVPGEVLETPGGSVFGIVVEDIDGDGVNELLSTVGEAVEIHSTDGGSLQLMSTVPLPGRTIDLEVADIDGDGILDMVTNTRPDDEVAVLRGDGEGGFAVWQQIAVGPRPRGMKVADLDGDGAPEVVVALESCQGGWLDPESTCDPSATAIVSGLRAENPSVEVLPAGPYYNNEIALVDLEEDGALDIVALTTDFYAASEEPYYNVPGSFVLHRGDGNGGFSPAEEVEQVRGPADGLARDLDGDGWPELVIIAMDGPVEETPLCRLTIFPTPGDGGLGEPVSLVVGPGGHALASLEINGDGVPDFVVADLQEEALHLVLSNP